MDMSWVHCKNAKQKVQGPTGVFQRYTKSKKMTSYKTELRNQKIVELIQ